MRCGVVFINGKIMRCGTVLLNRTARKHRTVKSPVIFDILTCRILKFDTSHRNFDTMSNIELRYIALNAFCLPPPRIPVHFYADIEPFFPTYVQYRLSKSYRFDIWFIDIVSNSIFEIISILWFFLIDIVSKPIIEITFRLPISYRTPFIFVYRRRVELDYQHNIDMILRLSETHRTRLSK